jgi:hypothetical protein
MAILGIDLSDAGALAAESRGETYRLLPVAKGGETVTPWAGFALHDGTRVLYGPAAEDAWFTSPRRVTNGFLARLTHDPVALSLPGKVPSHSELAFHFLGEFIARVVAGSGQPERVALAVPGAYLRDAATEEERIGLLLGIASELKLPLAAIVDLACAGLADPAAPALNPALPVLVVDVHLLAAEVSLLGAGERMVRRAYAEVPHAGMAQLLKHLNGAMGNRFLRHTTFDILADGRIEQAFYRQTKAFVQGGAAEFRYHVNTEQRAYEMPAKHEQLVADAQAFIRQIEAVLQPFARQQGVVPDACTVVLTERATLVPGLEARLRAAGYRRVLHLAAGAAARGAARLAARTPVPADLADVPVETSLPLSDLHRGGAAPWRVHLHKGKGGGGAVPTHVVIGGTGHPIGGNGTFTIGTGAAGPDLVLPGNFDDGADGAVELVREGGRLWLREPGRDGAQAMLTALDPGDRVSVHGAGATGELLFIHCVPAGMAPGGHA